MKNVYLFQPQFVVEVRKEKNYWLPYSAGCIWSYAAQFKDISDNFELKEIIFKREKQQAILDRLENPDICGFSCYSWNHQYCVTLAEKIKKKWPECKIIFGGAEVHSSFLNHVFIDSLVFAEGEKAFVKILRDYLASQEIEVIYPKSRLEDLDIPSPYLTGLFDRYIDENPTAIWAGVLETNRGCPYSCTFCDWGGITYSKIKKFNLERVQQELDWMAKNNVAYLMTADANFGIFKERDLEIAKLIRAAADVPGSKLESMNVNFAKNSSETVYELGKILGPLLRGGITFSLQSMNEDTLEAVKRTNMEINKFGDLVVLGEQYGILNYTEMILGLPLETVETWKEGITKLLELGQHQNIDLWLTQLLLNSELATTESRQKYKITSVMAKNYLTLENTGEFDECVELIELINGTSTMTTEEMVEAYLYSWMIVHFHVTGYSQMIARYCYSICNIPYRTFYDRLHEKLQLDPILGTHQKEFGHVLYTYLTTGELISTDGFKGHTIYGMSFKFIYDHKDLVTKLAIETAKELTILPQNIIDLQENFIFDPQHTFPREFQSDVNILNWTKTPTRYQIDNKSAGNPFDFYFSRRKNLLKNKFIPLTST
jgi:putative methyltransferase